MLLLLTVGLGSWQAWNWLNPSFSTGIGEQRVLRLEDGSRITLNANTRLSVDYDNARRHVAITEGEAYFSVAKNPARPFVVTAGTLQVRALGTAFVVRTEQARTAVTLVEGKVSVKPVTDAARPAAPAEVVLSPGRRLLQAAAGPPRVDRPRLESVTAWRRGEVILNHTPLLEAIVELNRYDETQLVIDDPRIADLPISGIYQAGDSSVFAETMAKLYDLKVMKRDEQLHLVRPDGRGGAG